MRPNKDRQNLWLWVALLLPLLWLAAGLAQITEQAHGLSALAVGLTALLNDPLNLRWCSSTPKFLLAVLVLYPLGVYCYLLDQADRRPGEEHGSAYWGNAKELNERYRNRKDPWQEIILSQNVRLSNDSYQHQRNLHVVVIGGSGSGKTRFFVKPNALQCSGSYFFLDPKGELTYSLGGAMEENGVTVTVIDFVHFRRHYNPVAYLKTDEDAMKLAYALVFNTKKNPAASGGENEFWDKSAVMFLASLILYILYESPLYERNLNTMMDMILECKVSEDSYDENRMDILFSELEQRDPHHPAVLQYRSFKLGSAKTLSSIMVTAVSNLHMLQSAAFAEMIATDEMFLPKLGVEKRAIFCVIPDNDDTFNFMVALVFAALHFGVLGAFGLDGHIPAVILADQILESHIHTSGIALVLIAVKIIVDGNEPGVKQREHTLNEIASLNAVSPKPGKVFYDDAVDLIGPHHLNQLLDFGTLKVCPAIPVVDKFKDFCMGGLRHGRNKFVQRKVLVFNAHTVVFVILQGKADIKGNHIFLHWLSTSSQCSNSLWKRKRTVIRFSLETSTRSISRSIRAAVNWQSSLICCASWDSILYCSSCLVIIASPAFSCSISSLMASILASYFSLKVKYSSFDRWFWIRPSYNPR